MGSMRQLASMIRHVHEAHAQGTAEENTTETLLLAQGDADFGEARYEGDAVGDPAAHAFQRN